METLNALEVGWIANRLHVIAIGEETSGDAMRLDAIDESTYWRMNFSAIETNTVTLTDLAIIDNYIVVTSKVFTGSSHFPFYTGRVWRIDKPTVSGSSLFPCNIIYKNLGNTIFIGSKFLVRALEQDNYVTSFKHAISTNGVNLFTLNYYNAAYYNQSIVVNETSTNYYIFRRYLLWAFFT